MAQIQSGASSDLLTIDPTAKAARALLYDPTGASLVRADGDAPAAIYGVPMLGANDRSLLPLRADRLGGLASAMHTPIVHESFEGTTIHPIRWLNTATTMAVTQSSVAGLLFNSGAITNITTGYMIQSARRIMKMQRAPIQFKARARLARVNNSVMELGFGDAATFNGANTTGAYWQVTAAGAIVPVLTFNSVDITGSDISGSIDVTRYYTWDVFLDDDEATFVVQDTSTGLIISKQSLKLPLASQRLWSASQVAAQVRLYNTGVAPATAPQLFLTDVMVTMLDAMLGMTVADTMSALGRGPVDHPFAGTQLAQWANSAEPANATLSNSAASYTTLGGKFQFAAVAGAATDFVLFGFQVPAPANLHITGIEIETWNTVVAVATTPTLLTWGIAVGATTVTLASGTPMRRGLGAQSLPVGAAPGAKAERIAKEFRTPLFCGANRYVQVILRMPVATATATEVIAGMVNIDGYFA